MKAHSDRPRASNTTATRRTLLLAIALLISGRAGADSQRFDDAGSAVATTEQAADVPKVNDDNAVPSRWALPRYPGVRVFIDSSGNVLLDDEPADEELMHEAFSHVQGNGGVVWYRRQNPHLEPTGPVASAVDRVIGILSGYKLAVELFEADFPDPEKHRESLQQPTPDDGDELTAQPQESEG